MDDRPIVDPRVLTGLARAHYQQTVTIQQATTTRGADGSVIDSWANLASHVDLVGQVATLSGGEKRTKEQAFLQATHRINLAGYYPSIVERMRAVSGGKNFDILLVTQTSQRDHTELFCELVE